MSRTVIALVVFNLLLTGALIASAVVLFERPSVFHLARASTVTSLERQVAADQRTRSNASSEAGRSQGRILAHLTALDLYARETWGLCALARSWSSADPTKFGISPLTRAMAQTCNEIGVPSGTQWPAYIAH